MAALRGIDPLFVYAVVASESNFDPLSRNGEARGLMQIKPDAWREASRLPYETNVWLWRTNLEVGMDRLASIRTVLAGKNVLSFPRLWASYHYSLDFAAERGFDMSRIPRPLDPLSYRLWSGDSHPLAPPP
jgi:soluble lytic murein transglycosylase-like protein